MILAAFAVATGCGGGGDGRGTATVAVTATDALRFEPRSVAAAPGRVVTFRVTNSGELEHEFVIGDEGFHAKHRADMAAAHGAHGDAEGGKAVDLPPGKTLDVTFTMPTTAPTFACYVDSHADAGMVGVVTYPS